jgi:23S rRNA (guanine745-N1)-methyltransferase
MTTSADGPLDSVTRDAGAALDRSLGVLACPHCGAALARVDRSLRCSNGHTFDIARQGYVGFTSGGGPHHQGDTAEMVSARDAFLAAGYYAPIVTAIAEHAPLTGWCVELAGGTGYYIGGVLDESPGLGGVTVDVSKNAARLAAHAHERLASVTADVRATLPFASGSVDLVLSIFGPRRGDEVARILAPSGSAVVVTPAGSHLHELRERFALLGIDPQKDARLETAMVPLASRGSRVLEYVVELPRPDVVNAIMMGPNAFHRERAEIETHAESLPPTFRTTVAVTVSRFGR